jgi:hypothetical protein
VWYAAFSNHCSLFPGSSVIGTLKNELKDYSTSKGTIQFPVDKPLSAALLKKGCPAEKDSEDTPRGEEGLGGPSGAEAPQSRKRNVRR